MIENPEAGMLVCDASYRLGVIEEIRGETFCDVVMVDGVRLPKMPFCYLFVPSEVAATCRARARNELRIAKTLEKAVRDHAAAEMVKALRTAERLLVHHGDPFQGDDWDAVQSLRSLIAKADCVTPAPTNTTVNMRR